MAGSWRGHWPLVLGAVFLLAGCEDGAGRFGERSGGTSGGGVPLAQGGGPTPQDGDTEAPDVFEKSETGLWDGRPSLGGIWVAHPDVGQPQRVLIQNEANAKSVVGALFRRERENPGPRFQISSEAAAELGILAGQPTQLRVVALRRAVPEIVPEPAPADEAVAGTAPASDTGAEPAEDAAATAAAAVAAVGAAPEAADGSVPTEDAAGAAAPLPAEAQPVPVPETRSPSSFGRRGRPAAASVEDVVAVPEDAPPTSFGRRNRREAALAPDAAPVAPGEPADISVAPLDGAAPEAPPEPSAAPAAAIQRPFIQTATFSSEGSANAAAETLRAEGLNATVVTASGSGSWRVLVGPAATAAEQSDLLGRVRALGYRDAFPVAG